MKPDAYHAFTAQLRANLQADERVLGLVLLGSTAHQRRAPDAWSDHDFFVITRSGEQEAFRTQFTWLPDHESVVLTVRETAHGLKILYANGHLLEFAAFDVAEIALAKANEYTVAFDRGGVAAAMQGIASTQAAPITAPGRQRDMGMFLCLLVVGAGRVARGEAISGQMFIRAHALSHLMPVLAQTLNADDPRLDNLDPLRRFEQVYPQTGAAINAALGRAPVAAALGLLDVFEEVCASQADFPVQAVTTVRDLLHGAAQSGG